MKLNNFLKDNKLNKVKLFLIVIMLQTLVNVNGKSIKYLTKHIHIHIHISIK